MGFIMVATIAGFFALMGFKLFPAYSENYGVVAAMKGVAGEAGSGQKDLRTIQNELQSRFDVGYVNTVQGKDAKVIKDKAGDQLNMNYEYRAPLVYNLDFVAKFDYTVPLNGRTAP
jgi:hypothetical protein